MSYNGLVTAYILDDEDKPITRADSYSVRYKNFGRNSKHPGQRVQVASCIKPETEEALGLQYLKISVAKKHAKAGARCAVAEHWAGDVYCVADTRVIDDNTDIVVPSDEYDPLSGFVLTRKEVGVDAYTNAVIRWDRYSNRGVIVKYGHGGSGHAFEYPKNEDMPTVEKRDAPRVMRNFARMLLGDGFVQVWPTAAVPASAIAQPQSQPPRVALATQSATLGGWFF